MFGGVLGIERKVLESYVKDQMKAFNLQFMKMHVICQMWVGIQFQCTWKSPFAKNSKLHEQICDFRIFLFRQI